MSYYYLIASLPSLRADGERPIDYAAFLEMCRPSVSRSVLRALEQLTVDSKDGPLVKEWAALYRGLRDELAFQRRQRLGREAEPPSPRSDETAAAVANALSAKDPLEAEKALLSYEFELLERLTAMHYFDDHVLYGYALKLKLLERRDGFDRETGIQEFRDLFEDIRGQVLSFQQGE